MNICQMLNCQSIIQIANIKYYKQLLFSIKFNDDQLLAVLQFSVASTQSSVAFDFHNGASNACGLALCVRDAEDARSCLLAGMSNKSFSLFGTLKRHE